MPNSLPGHSPAGIGGLLASAIGGAERGAGLARALLFHKLGGFLERASNSTADGNVFDKLLNELEVETLLSGDELRRVPAGGPVVVVANHPFGLLEGAVLASLCLRVRPDVKIMANFLLPCAGPLREHFILVDPYARRNSAASNRAPMREAVEWLRSGGLLIVFPAGNVSYPDWKCRAAVDRDWNPTVARMIRLGGAAALPVYFRGSNSAVFHLLGMVHPRLRTLRLPSEFLNKRGRRVELRIGRTVEAEKLTPLTDAEMISRLRARTYMLGHCPKAAGRRPAPPARALAAPAEPAAGRFESLPERCVLLENRDWRVVCFRGADEPELMREIGRLREETFRAAGEGTGRALDLDRFDPYYDQLVLWSKKNREIAGGYRLGRSEEILGRFGPQGLYTSTLFRFQPEFFRRIGPAIELGRSFVSLGYQKQYAPLLTLWQGIGAYVARHPQCRCLFGPVSVSAQYQPLSRQVLASALGAAASDSVLERLVEPRARLRSAAFPIVGEEWKRLGIGDVDELSEWLSELEPDGKGVPVLIRQYLRLGGRLLGFSVDRKFANVLDGLIVVDLLRTEPALLDRYLGRTGAEIFRAHHAAIDATISDRNVSLNRHAGAITM